MRITKGHYNFTRQLGIGEREHVRQGLLGVGFFSPWHITDQLAGAVKAADKLGMMLRIHLNIDRLGPNTRNEIDNFMHLNTAHQYEPWLNLSRQGFDSMCKKLEIVITENLDSTDHANIGEMIYEGITDVWTQSGGRFLKGNFGQLTDEQLKPLYPNFYYDPEQFWSDWRG